MNPRLFVYRSIARWLCRRFRRPVSPGLENSADIASSGQGKLWFHAASVGELEGLLPVIRECAAHNAVCAVSVWSHSGDQALIKLKSDLGVSVLRAPHEGNWSIELDKLKPRAVVGYRYDAWPDLWASCSELKIPILLLGVRMRPSIRLLATTMRLLGVSLPRWIGTVFSPQERLKLASAFPHSQFFDSPNPRWQQAAARVAGAVNTRAKEVGARIARLPHPVLFLSQIWESDFDSLGMNINQWKGSAVVIPHSLEKREIAKIAKRFESQGFSIEKTSERDCAESSDRNVLFVNEQGILTELYRFAHFAYVGGGFEKGIHSIIEPACAGMPVACGPMRIEEFEEVEILHQLGALSILRKPKDWEACLKQWTNDWLGVRGQSKILATLVPSREDYWWSFLQSQAFVD